MNKAEKVKVCQKHRPLLLMMHCWGHGIALQKQLRTLAVALGLYVSPAMFDRGVRNLKAASVLKRQTFLDGNSDVLLFRKFAYEYLLHRADSQHVAAIKKRQTQERVLRSMCRLQLIINLVERQHLTTPTSALQMLSKLNSTFHLRRSELLPYFTDRKELFSTTPQSISNYTYQRTLLERDAQVLHNLAHPTVAVPLPQRNRYDTLSLALLHSKGVHIQSITRSTVTFCMFALTSIPEYRVMERVVLACQFARLLLPGHAVAVSLYAVSKATQQTMITQLTRKSKDVPFWHRRMISAGFTPDDVALSVRSLGFDSQYFHGIAVI